ncbi:hypothetical protein [Streptomyces sp. NPDC001422]|uniref:hypothetical protein n=1 Tax=Streptomyces sp. NPDC001422 TaxID=3364575 RepID=UPI003694AD1C
MPGVDELGRAVEQADAQEPAGGVAVVPVVAYGLVGLAGLFGEIGVGLAFACVDT